MPIIEIGDPDIDAAELNRRIAAQVEARREQGAYRDAVAEVGPAALLPCDDAVAGNTAVGEDRARSPSAALDAQLVDLMVDAGLQEPRFTSDVPVFGPLIVGFRRLWNWMSTKWYVLPLMWAQSDLNARYSVLLSHLFKRQQDSAKTISELESRISELERAVRAQRGDKG